MSKVKIKFLGIPNVMRYYRSDNIVCDTRSKESCIIEVEAEKAAQVMIDHPNLFEYVTKNGEKLIEKEITDYQNKMIRQISSTRGINIIDNKGVTTKVEPKVEPKPVVVDEPKQEPIEKPTVIAKTPKGKGKK